MSTTPNPMPPDEMNSRLGKLGEEVGSIRGSVETFINNSQERWDRDDREKGEIWAAIKENAAQLSKAVERLSAKGQITWPMIVMTIMMIVAVSGMAAGVAYRLMDSQVQQLKISDAYMEKYHDRMDDMQERLAVARMRQLEIRAEYQHELGREDHAAIRDLDRSR